MSKLIGVFMVLVFLMIIAWYFLLGTVGVKVYNAVEENGLKGVSERIWHGKNGSDSTPVVE